MYLNQALTTSLALGSLTFLISISLYHSSSSDHGGRLELVYQRSRHVVWKALTYSYNCQMVLLPLIVTY